MSAGGDGQEKTEEATPRRKEDARKKGTVTKSQDVTGAAVLFVLLMVLPGFASKFGEGVLNGFRAAGSHTPTQIGTAEMSSLAASILQPVLIATGILFGAVMAVGLVANFGQVGFVLSGQAMTPDLKKIDPFQGMKRMFSRRSLFEGIKAFAKSMLFGWIAYSVISKNWDGLIGLAWVGPKTAVAMLGGLMLEVVQKVAIVWLVIAVLDYFFQRKETDKQLKMTKDELKREMKEQEGSPEQKHERMKRARKLSRGRMMEQVKQADVIITNPTHFAVAIKYDRSKMYAPMVVAKGQDLLALKIREVAKKAKVPIVENKPLARALYAQCELGDFVPRDLFLAVAEILAYVYKTIQSIR